MKTRTLTPKQQFFAVLYVRYSDATRAYKEAFGPKHCKASSLHVNASHMLHKPRVQDEIKRLIGEREKPYILTANQVLERLTKLADTTLLGSDRIRALDLLGKYHKLFTDGGQTFVSGEQVLVCYGDAQGQALPISPLRSAPALPQGALALPQGVEDATVGKGKVVEAGQRDIVVDPVKQEQKEKGMSPGDSHPQNVLKPRHKPSPKHAKNA